MNKAKPGKSTKDTAKMNNAKQGKKPNVEMSADDLKKVSGGAQVDYFGRKAG
jgi:hypothetical protein